MRYSQKTHFIGILLAVGCLAGLAWAETLEMVTFYPAAASSGFDRIHVSRMTVGNAAYSLTNPADANLPDGRLLVQERLGIGTAGPAEKLDVSGSAVVGLTRGTTSPGAADYKGLFVRRRDNSGTSGLFFNSNSGGAEDWENMILQVEGGGSNLVVKTGPTAAERLRVDTSGNVGIGTARPTESLEVSGNLAFSPVAPGGTTNRFIRISGAPPSGANAVGTGISLMAQPVGGNRGTGGRATVSGGDVFSPNGMGGEARIGGGSVFGPNGLGGMAVLIGGDGSGPGGRGGQAVVAAGRGEGNGGQGGDVVLQGGFGTNGAALGSVVVLTGNPLAERMRVTSTGAVGIGTSNPVSRLHVSGQTTVDNGNLVVSTSSTPQLYLFNLPYAFAVQVAPGGNYNNGVYYLGDTSTGAGGIRISRNPTPSESDVEINGKIFTSGNRTYLLGVDRSRHHWIMSGGTAEPAWNALGFNIGFNNRNRQVEIGPQWTFVNNSSDARLKKDITVIPNALERLSAVRGVNFHWADLEADQRLRMGVLAQEVEKTFPSAVLTGSDGTKSVAYLELIPPMIEALKELKQENDALKKQVEALEKKQ